MRFYTYIHRKATNGEVFYVGKGSRKDRAKLKNGRSLRWNRIVGKHGHTVEILAHWATEQEAFDHERFLIWCYRDMGIDLCNHTDGGEGATGNLQSRESYDKRNAKLRGRKCSPETLALMRKVQANKVISPETRAKISKTMTGNPLFAGANNPMAKKVVCKETGAIFPTATAAGLWLQSLGHAKASFKNICAVLAGEKKTAYGYTWSQA